MTNAEAPKLPIKDFKEALVAVIAIGILVGDLANKKPTNLVQYLGLIGKLQLGAEGFENIIPQALDMDSAEGAECLAAVQAEFGVTSEEAGELIQDAIAALPTNIKLGKSIAKYVKKQG